MNNLDSLNKEELLQLYKKTEDSINQYYNQEQSIKRILNSIYGAFGNQYFYFFNIDIAESITQQGQNAILYTEKLINTYFNQYWHKDVELHQKLGIEVKGQVLKPVVIYIDTDSVAADSKIIVNNEEMAISEMFRNFSKISNCHMSDRGDEIVKPENCYILNYTEEKGLYNAPVSKIIRHRVKKKKWKLITKSGKEVIVTNDHSMMVLRDGKLIKIKPSEIDAKKDKVISIYKTNI